MTYKIFIALLLITTLSACNKNNTDKENEELENVDALLKQDSEKTDSLKRSLDSIYNR